MFRALNHLFVVGMVLSATVVISSVNHARAGGGNEATTMHSGKADNTIVAPTDEATLKEFVARLKARYVGKPAGLVTKELHAIAFTARAQDVQDRSHYCQGWVKAGTLGTEAPGKCLDGMPVLRCEPLMRDGSRKGLICYNLGGIKGTDLRFVTVNLRSTEFQPVYLNMMTYAEFKAMESRYAADPAKDPARWTEENEKALAVTLNKIATGKLTAGNPNSTAEPPDNSQKLSAADQADIDAEVRGDIEDNRINNSASAADDDGPITAPTDEATLAEFIGKLKARYIGKPSGLVTKELSAIAFTGRAQDVQIGDRYCRPWVAATFHGKCGDNQPTLRCEPGSRNGENGIACYNLAGIRNTDLRFVTKYFMSRTTQRTYTDFMTYAAFKAMADQYAANPASDPARSPPPADMTALVPPPSEPSQTGQSPNDSSTGNADLDGLKNDYAAAQTSKPTTQAELDSAIGSLTLQLGNQVVDFSEGSSPSLGTFYEKVSTEGIVPDTARCTATVSRVLGDCRRSANALGCSGINIYAMNERQKHTTTCYELWGVTGTNLRFVMAYSYWDAEDVVRYAGTLTVAAYRNLRQLQANDEKMLGEGMKMFNDMLSGSDNGRCALATNGTTGEKPPGCP